MHNNGRMLGVIGGSGFYSFFGPDARRVNLDTPYGEPSAPITVGAVGDHEVAFLPRHGVKHEFSPHTVPYRANMWALRALGVRRIFGPCAAGSSASTATTSCPAARSAASTRDPMKPAAPVTNTLMAARRAA